VNELSRAVGIGNSMCSQHLAKLRRSKIVEFRKEATATFYRCVSPEVTAVISALRELGKLPSRGTVLRDHSDQVPDPPERPFYGLLDNQPIEIIDFIAREEVKNHRRLVEESQALYDEMRRSNEDPAAELAYLSKVVALYSQRVTLANLVEILGYTPEVAPQKSH
jgi:DNA-binding transcriptional ArsR family regulator